MNNNLQQILSDLKNNQQLALQQLLALLGAGIKQHELSSRLFAKFISSTDMPKTPLSKVSPGKRLSLPDVNISLSKSIQNKTVFLHKEFEALDILLTNELSEVIVSDDEIRQGHDIEEIYNFELPSMDIDQNNELVDHDMIARHGQDLFDQQISKLQLTDDQVTESGFTVIKKKQISTKLQFDDKIIIQLDFQNQNFLNLTLEPKEPNILHDCNWQKYIEQISEQIEEEFLSMIIQNSQYEDNDSIQDNFQSLDTIDNPLAFSTNLNDQFVINKGESMKFSEITENKNQIFMQILNNYKQKEIDVRQLQNGDLLLTGK
ncbi:hypothetical protein SS50377_23310 [Spironucleus salmonicida]|uniref:Uncharacterized protein n=1 Tax=Spironucleus salmonicida TaxID=348837 RepID=V6M1W4_9EUKA|nr:hypothetical protein SS50377_23310 [Spironucleus salmonicida]|eukprot:EST47179.1 Hypothetical protein SS50377_12690 [Spironucleus salmonicida]